MSSNDLPDWLSDSELQDFCDEIIHCMVVHGGMDETMAYQKLEQSGLCSQENTADAMSRALLFHEIPYYWAMHLIYGNDDPQWFNNPALGLWPPPEDVGPPPMK